MAEFKNIPHKNRFVYKHTFLNEIALLFTYQSINMDDAREVLEKNVKLLGLEMTCQKELSSSCNITVKDKDALFVFSQNAVLVSLPSKEYKDFTLTGFVWDHLSSLLNDLCVVPVFWSFTKGNRWLFNKTMTPDMIDEAYKVVLSKTLLDATDEKHFYVEESTDKSCVFTCRYGSEKIADRSSIGLKTMIASQSYSIKNLKDQIFEINDLMFDVWYWSVSEEVKKIMQFD